MQTLSITINPSDLPDPDVLSVQTYANVIPALRPYVPYAMQARIALQQPVGFAYQQVYIFTSAAMQSLQHQLTPAVYQDIMSIEGNAYVAQADLETDLAELGVPQEYYPTIEQVVILNAVVAVYQLDFTLTIQTGDPTPPNIVFNMARTDIFQDLVLNAGRRPQTAQYFFVPVTYAATFVSSTVPKFSGSDFGNVIWPIAGEPNFERTLQMFGGMGIALPSASGLAFNCD
ncbi:MAG: hypothetical protein M3441_04065 [Chloroflexota bacterium]|nr:hypothetical protein [Chloroflexota bacterium]